MGGERERDGKAYLRAMLWWRYSMDDGDSVVLGKQGQSKRTLPQFKGGVAFCARLEDRQCWVVETSEKSSVQTLISFPFKAESTT